MLVAKIIEIRFKFDQNVLLILLETINLLSIISQWHMCVIKRVLKNSDELKVLFECTWGIVNQLKMLAKLLWF